MARKKQQIPAGFVLFDVVYEDGTQTSNRKVPAAELGGLDGDMPARIFIEVQDARSANCPAARAGASKQSSVRAMPPIPRARNPHRIATPTKRSAPAGRTTRGLSSQTLIGKWWSQAGWQPTDK